AKRQIRPCRSTEPVSERPSGLFGTCGAAAALALARRDNPHPLDTARIGIEHVELKAGYSRHHFAARRHPAQGVEDHPADRVDGFPVLPGGEAIADHLRHFINFSTTIDDIDAVPGHRDHWLVVV